MIFPPVVSGIDTLYWFYETSQSYEKFYTRLYATIEQKKSYYKAHAIAYDNQSLVITIGKEHFSYLGNGEGFLWFTPFDEKVKIGFKDPQSNQGLHNVRIQLSAKGIYTCGIFSLSEWLDTLLHDMIIPHPKHVTRVDLNMFVFSDLSWLCKEDFSTKKQSYRSLFQIIETKRHIQTLYIGKKPFLLRIYNKQAEMKTSGKFDLMQEYFTRYGIALTPDMPLFNIECELHREFLKGCGVGDMETLLSSAQSLFRHCLSLVRLIDEKGKEKFSLTDKNRNRAPTHPLWEYFKDSYTLSNFLASDNPLHYHPKKRPLYNYERAINEHIGLAKKYDSHGVVIDKDFYADILRLRFSKNCEEKEFTVISHSSW